MNAKSIALVDLSCIFKRNYERPDNRAIAGQRTLNEIASIGDRVEHVVLCLDAPPYSRKEIFSDYKAHREAPEPGEVYQKRWLYDECKRLGYAMARVPGAEGDDVIATLSRVYGEFCPEVWLIGADKDLAQCVTENVRQLAPAIGERKEELRGPAEIKKKYDVWPSQIPLYLALCGDKSDNIPGVPGIGQVKASALIAEHKTLEGIANNLRMIGGAMGKNLATHWEQLVLSLKLTTLDAHLPLDAMALLEKRAPEPAPAEPAAEAGVFVGNETPMPEPEPLPEVNTKPEPIIGKDPRADEFLRQEAAARKQASTRAAADLREVELERERNADRAAREQQERHEREEQREQDWRREMRAEAEAARPAPPAPPAPVALLPGPVKANLRGLALLRAPFEKHQISKLPKGTKDQNNCAPDQKRSCNQCGGYHHPKMVHLDYVGHAALTDRLLEADPAWSWEPMSFGPDGLPVFDKTGGLWIKLTVCGVTRLGYGHAATKSYGEPGAREKEVIGDALRNAAMRFGAALDLWHKGEDLHGEDWDAAAAWEAVSA